MYYNNYTPNDRIRRLHTPRGLTAGAWEVSTKPPQAARFRPRDCLQIRYGLLKPVTMRINHRRVTGTRVDLFSGR